MTRSRSNSPPKVGLAWFSRVRWADGPWGRRRGIALARSSVAALAKFGQSLAAFKSPADSHGHVLGDFGAAASPLAAVFKGFGDAARSSGSPRHRA